MAAGFGEGFIEADGFRIRYMEAGEGPALVHLFRINSLPPDGIAVSKMPVQPEEAMLC